MWRLALTGLALLPLAGCVADPYYQGGYAGGYYGTPAYGYPQTYGYTDGYPTMVYGGETVVLIPGGGGWGWYDRERHWHSAPPHIEHRLREAHPQGLPPRPEHGGWGGSPQPRQGWGGPPPGQPPVHAVPPSHGGFAPAAAPPVARSNPPPQRHEERRGDHDRRRD
jgi:hypothetical protein